VTRYIVCSARRDLELGRCQYFCESGKVGKYSKLTGSAWCGSFKVAALKAERRNYGGDHAKTSAVSGTSSRTTTLSDGARSVAMKPNMTVNRLNTSRPLKS